MISAVPFTGSDPSKSIRLSPNGFALFEPEKRRSSSECLVVVDYMPPLLIPKGLYDSTKNFDYVRLQYPTNDAIEIMTEELEEYTSLFFLPIKDFYALKNSMPSLVFTHQSSYLYKNAESIGTMPEDFIQLFIDHLFIDLTVRKAGKLRMINRFIYALDADILYYLLNVIKQFALNRTQCSLLIYDEKGAYATRIAALCRPYFNHLKINAL